MPGPLGAGRAAVAATVREDARARLLAAAVQVYAQHGYGGATTRAIAAEAEVNEVTLFRLFGTKEALLDEAIASTPETCAVTTLPSTPEAPLRELTHWCRTELARLREVRKLIRKSFADSEAHPSHVRRTSKGLDAAAETLRRYASRLAAAELTTAPPRERDTAVAMLLSTLLCDAVGREEMGGVFRAPEAESPRRYAAMFLTALGVTTDAE